MRRGDYVMEEKEPKSLKSKKEAYEKLFNEVFGTSIKWSKLSIEELTQLATVLANPQTLIKRLGGIPKEDIGPTTFAEILKSIMEDYEGPIVKLVKKFLKGESHESKEQSK